MRQHPAEGKGPTDCRRVQELRTQLLKRGHRPLPPSAVLRPAPGPLQRLQSLPLRPRCGLGRAICHPVQRTGPPRGSAPYVPSQQAWPAHRDKRHAQVARFRGASPYLPRCLTDESLHSPSRPCRLTSIAASAVGSRSSGRAHSATCCRNRQLKFKMRSLRSSLGALCSPKQSSGGREG
jgi:hypothetical protein